jgi:hypothetical protein
LEKSIIKFIVVLKKEEEGYQLLLLFYYITSPKEILSSNVVSVLKLLVVFCAVVKTVTMCLPIRILFVCICVVR